MNTYALQCRFIAFLHSNMISFLNVNSSVCSAELVFVSLPANKTVIEGEDANFTCSTTVNGNPDPTQWRLMGGEDNIDQRVQLSTTNIPGVNSATVSGPLRSPLILTNVSRLLDGLFVFCLGEDQQGRIIEQPDPPAVLGVFCEFLLTSVGGHVWMYSNHSLPCTYMHMPKHMHMDKTFSLIPRYDIIQK